MTPMKKYIVFSDCHRGSGDAGDEFARNSVIFKCALEYYLKEGFTYIELGDAEELWENDDFLQIYITHTSVYDLLARFHDPDPARTRYLKVLGNHDEEWRDGAAPLAALFPGIRLHDAIRLGPILLLHGHQADPLCAGFRARVSRFLVRKVWSGLQRFGIGDPTRAADNPGRCDEIDNTLYRLAKGRDDREIMNKIETYTAAKPDFASAAALTSAAAFAPLTGQAAPADSADAVNSAASPGPAASADSPGAAPFADLPGNVRPLSGLPAIVIAGHTHRPVYANLSLTERRYLESGVRVPGVRRKEKAEAVYYNAGSCVHPRCITGIEITARESAPSLALVKWGYAAEDAASNPAAAEVAAPAAAPGTSAQPDYRLHIRREILEGAKA